MKRKYYQIYNHNHQELHQKGYTLIHNAFQINSDILTKLKYQIAARGKTLFSLDRKRKHTILYPTSRALKKLVQEINDQPSHFIRHPDHQQSQWAIIKSEPGAQRQPLHKDYIQSKELDQASDDQIPLAVIAILMDQTTLIIWDYQNHMEKILELSPGDLIIFRGDFIHAGNSYQEENYRIHCYIDNVKIPRIPNQTHILDSEELKELKRRIKMS